MRLLAQNRIYLLLTVMFAGMWMIEGSMQACRSSITRPTDSADSSIYALAGEFRTVFANLLWVKVDKYHHESEAHGGDAFTNKEVLTMIRMVTQLDPHFIEAYRTGAMMLYLGFDKDNEARKFLLEGISNNPNSWELYEEMGMFVARREGDYKGSLPYFRQAANHCKDDFFHKKLVRLIHSIERDIKAAGTDIPSSRIHS